jgi:hypothetical protein
MVSSAPAGRQSVATAVGQLLGPNAFDASQAAFRLAHEEQFGWFMSQRIDVTVAKFMHAIAQCYAAGAQEPRLFVEGARLQQGAGHSAWLRVGDKAYLRGTQAAHFGIGTLTRQGTAVSALGLRQLHAAAQASGVGATEIHEAFPASSQLVAYGLGHDAVTYFAPAFVNQTEGLLERSKQLYLRGLLPGDIPNTLQRLQSLLTLVGERVVYFLTENEKVVIRPIDERLLQLSHHGYSEYRQYPGDIENLMFGGQEQRLLEALKSEAQDAGSEFRRAIESVARWINSRAADLAQLAEQSREERSDVSADGATERGLT